MNSKIEIYTDGSSLGNPGPGGWGVVVVQNKKIIKDFGGHKEQTTNNKMELSGAIEALKYLIYQQDLTKTKKAIIYTDSTYVLNGITSWVYNWEKNGWKTANKKPVLNKEFWLELVDLSRKLNGIISWEKVKGHSGHIYNDRADEIATNNSSKKI